MIFVNYLNLLSFGLSRSFDPGYEFGKLTQVTRVIIFFFIFYNGFFFQFHNTASGLLWIRFCNLLWFIFSRVIIILWLSMRVNRLVQVNFNQFSMLLFWYLYKKNYFKYLFLVKLYFFQLSKLFLNLLDQLVNPHVVFFLLDKTLAMFE